MPRNQELSSVAGEWMSKIADLFASPDKNLDQVKKSVQADLDKLKHGSDVAANLYTTAANGFRKDLEEVNVSGTAQNEYMAMFEQKWREMEMGRKSSEILESPELSAMDGFINNLQNLPKLKSVLDSAEPQAGWTSLVKRFSDKVPGLGQFVQNGGFDSVLSAVGLGFLVKPKNQKSGENRPAALTTNDQPAQSSDTKEQAEKPRKTPNATLLMGDSITVGVPGVKNIFKINGKLDWIAKGGMSSGWGVGQAHEIASTWAGGKVQAPENAVILFGTNDLLGSPDEIIKNLQEIYRSLYKAGVKRVYAVTIPPHEGYERYDRSPKANKTRHEVNDWILGKDPRRPKPNYVHHVIDLCQERKNGGLATDGNPERLDKQMTGDNLHIVKEELAKVYQRELEIGSAEPDKTYPND